LKFCRRFCYNHNAMKVKFRLSLLLLGCLVVLALLAILMLYLAIRQVPAFYRETLDIPREKLVKGSDRILRQAAALESAWNTDGRWEILITDEEINGWLAVDLEENHPDVLPPSIGDPRVAIDENEISIACRYDHDGMKSILSVALRPSISERNEIVLRIVRARAGLLPVPLGNILDQISIAARQMQFHLEWRREGDDPVALLSLPKAKAGGRTVRIDAIRLGDGEIYIAGTSERE